MYPTEGLKKEIYPTEGIKIELYPTEGGKVDPEDHIRHGAEEICTLGALNALLVHLVKRIEMSATVALTDFARTVID